MGFEWVKARNNAQISHSAWAKPPTVRDTAQSVYGVEAKKRQYRYRKKNRSGRRRSGCSLGVGGKYSRTGGVKKPFSKGYLMVSRYRILGLDPEEEMELESSLESCRGAKGMLDRRMCSTTSQAQGSLLCPAGVSKYQRGNFNKNLTKVANLVLEEKLECYCTAARWMFINGEKTQKL